MTASRLAFVKPDARRIYPIGPWIFSSASGSEDASFDRPSEFAGALRQALSEAKDIELLFAIWEQNVDPVTALNRSLK